MFCSHTNIISILLNAQKIKMDSYFLFRLIILCMFQLKIFLSLGFFVDYNELFIFCNVALSGPRFVGMDYADMNRSVGQTIRNTLVDLSRNLLFLSISTNSFSWTSAGTMPPSIYGLLTSSAIWYLTKHSIFLIPYNRLCCIPATKKTKNFRQPKKIKRAARNKNKSVIFFFSALISPRAVTSYTIRCRSPLRTRSTMSHTESALGI